ncbi:hypothetical protein AKO1_014417 [Acrasis kona]|uniref:Uncharacterized protein n=1 Tax=Acrasis kona TaxID=1008807 RepID=A0AAW2Z0K1_9EUKA
MSDVGEDDFSDQPSEVDGDVEDDLESDEDENEEPEEEGNEENWSDDDLEDIPDFFAGLTTLNKNRVRDARRGVFMRQVLQNKPTEQKRITDKIATEWNNIMALPEMSNKNFDFTVIRNLLDSKGTQPLHPNLSLKTQSELAQVQRDPWIYSSESEGESESDSDEN